MVGLGTEAEAAAVVGYMDLLLVAMADGFLTFWSLLPLAGQLLFWLVPSFFRRGQRARQPLKRPALLFWRLEIRVYQNYLNSVKYRTKYLHWKNVLHLYFYNWTVPDYLIVSPVQLLVISFVGEKMTRPNDASGKQNIPPRYSNVKMSSSSKAEKLSPTYSPLTLIVFRPQMW